MMQEMILLGAGASVKAGVPDSYAMTRVIATRFANNHLSDHAHLIKFVIGGLLFQKGIRNEDPFGGVDVEELFNAVMLLADRSKLEAAPFIGSWHDMVDQFDRIAPGFYGSDRLNRAIYDSVAKEVIGALSQSPPSFADDKIDKALVAAVLKTVEDKLKGRSTHYLSSDSSVGRAVGGYLRELTAKWVKMLKSARPSSSEFGRELRKVLSETDTPGEGQVYRSVSEEMIRMLKDIVWIETAGSADYLKPMMTPLQSQSSLVIATLNYDNSVELAAESMGWSCDTGIDRWSTTARFDTDGDGLHLLKLHGSIDWALADDIPNQTMPHQVIRKKEGAAVKDDSYQPAVVFGQKNKLTADGPFLDLLQAFRHALHQADRLTVIGYSFRDEHINGYISQWMNADANRRLRIIDPGFGQNAVDYARALRAHCSERLDEIAEKAETALPQAFGA